MSLLKSDLQISLNPSGSMLSLAQQYMNTGIYSVSIKDISNNKEYVLQVAATSSESARSRVLEVAPSRLNSSTLEITSIVFSY